MSEYIISDLHEIWIRPTAFNPSPLPEAWIPVNISKDDRVISVNIDGINIDNPPIKTITINNSYQQQVIDISDIYKDLFVNLRLSEDRNTRSISSSHFSPQLGETLQLKIPLSVFYNQSTPKIDELLESIIIRGVVTIETEATRSQPPTLTPSPFRTPPSPPSPISLSILETVRDIRKDEGDIIIRFKPSNPNENAKLVAFNTQLIRYRRILQDRERELAKRLSDVNSEIVRLRRDITERTKNIERLRSAYETATSKLSSIIFDINLLFGLEVSSRSRTIDLQRLYDTISRTHVQLLRKSGILRQGSKTELLKRLSDAIRIAKERDGKAGALGGNIRVIREYQSRLDRLYRISERTEKSWDAVMTMMERAGTVIIDTSRIAISTIWRAITKIMRRVTLKILTKRIFYKIEVHVNITYTKTVSREINNLGMLTDDEPQPIDLSESPEKVHEVRLVIPWLNSLFDNEGRFIQEEKKKLDDIVTDTIERILEKYIDDIGPDEQLVGLFSYFTIHSRWDIGIKRVLRVKQFNTKTYAIFNSLDRWGYQSLSYITAELNWMRQKRLDGEDIIRLNEVKLIQRWRYDDWERYIEEIEKEKI